CRVERLDVVDQVVPLAVGPTDGDREGGTELVLISEREVVRVARLQAGVDRQVVAGEVHAAGELELSGRGVVEGVVVIALLGDRGEAVGEGLDDRLVEAAVAARDDLLPVPGNVVAEVDARGNDRLVEDGLPDVARAVLLVDAEADVQEDSAEGDLVE